MTGAFIAKWVVVTLIGLCILADAVSLKVVWRRPGRRLGVVVSLGVYAGFAALILLFWPA
jgi:hypothetical protein